MSHSPCLAAGFIPYLLAAGFPEPETELVFSKRRKWRFDLAWPDYHVALEVQGGLHAGGRHVRAKGYENDCRKLNQAQCEGWLLLYVPSSWLNNGEVFGYLEQALRARGWKGATAW